MNIQKIISGAGLCLLGLTLLASPTNAQVFDQGPSDPALFDSVSNVFTSPPFGSFGAQIAGNGSTEQLNLFTGGSFGELLTLNSGAEANLLGGFFDLSTRATSGSEVNIVDGFVTFGFLAGAGSQVNITGGTVSNGFDAGALDGDLTIGQAIAISERDVTLTGELADGSVFSLDLNSAVTIDDFDDSVSPDATLTLTLTVPEPSTLALLGLSGVMLAGRRRKNLIV